MGNIPGSHDTLQQRGQKMTLDTGRQHSDLEVSTVDFLYEDE